MQNVKLLCAIKRSVAEAKGTETMVKGSPGPLAVQRQRGWHRCQLFPCRPGERLTSDSGGEVALANLVVPPQRRVQAGPIASRGPQVKALQAHAAAFALQLAVAATWRRPSAGVTAEAEPQWLGPSGPALCGVPSTSGSFQAAEEEQVDTPHSGADLARWTAAAERYFTNCPTKHLQPHKRRDEIVPLRWSEECTSVHGPPCASLSHWSLFECGSSKVVTGQHLDSRPGGLSQFPEHDISSRQISTSTSVRSRHSLSRDSSGGIVNDMRCVTGSSLSAAHCRLPPQRSQPLSRRDPSML